MNKQVFNFCSGPAVLPEAVLTEAQQALVNWQDSGTSILSISHRSEAFLAMAAEMERDFRELLNIPQSYKILLLPGGATLQFALVPLNLFSDRRRAAYVDTGHWSKRAIEEAKKYGDIQVIAKGYEAALETDWRIPADVDYLHCTPNETIDGVEFTKIPKSPVPIVADMSSTILSRPINVTEFNMIYAGAQKNIGPSGLVIAIIHEALLKEALPNTPTLLQYKVQSDYQSLYNTPSTFAWYITAQVLQWLKRQGGLAAMAVHNQTKAAKLYAEIDKTGFYYNPVPKACRSWMNVPFRLQNHQLEPVFLQAAEAAGLINLQGHRSVGGLRASLYNAMPMAGVEALLRFMQDFEKRNG